MSFNSASTVQSSQSSKKAWFRWKWLRFALPLMLVLLGSGGSRWLSSMAENRAASEVITKSVERKTIPVKITANGTVNAERSINLSPKSAGVVRTLLVKEGDRVKQGQAIAIMDDTNLRGQLTQAQGQLAQQEANLQRMIAGNRAEDIAKAEAQLAEAEANLQQLRAGNRPQEIAQSSAQLEQARATLRQREEDLQRNQQLFNEGAISRQTVDQKRTDRDVAKMQVIAAEQALNLQKVGTRPEQIAQAEARVEQQRQTVAAMRSGNRSEDIDQARAQVQSARGSLENIEAQLNDTRVLAPFDGVVMKVYAETGSFVSPSMSGGNTASSSSSSILTLSSDRQQVIVNLSESQIAKVKLGQPVMIKVDAFSGETFTGKVSRIAPQATVSQNVTSFEVRVDVTSANRQKMRAGMNVEAQFEVDRLENALLVPNASVVREADKTGVYVLDRDRKPVFQQIEIGSTASGQTEVKSGLQGNEQVLVSPPPKQPASSGGIGLPRAPQQ